MKVCRATAGLCLGAGCWDCLQDCGAGQPSTQDCHPAPDQDSGWAPPQRRGAGAAQSRRGGGPLRRWGAVAKARRRPGPREARTRREARGSCPHTPNPALGPHHPAAALKMEDLEARQPAGRSWGCADCVNIGEKLFISAGAPHGPVCAAQLCSGSGPGSWDERKPGTPDPEAGPQG